jgi:hypothetical protein
MQSPNLCWNRDAVEQARSSPTLNFFPLSLFSLHLFGAEFDLINLVIYLKDCKAARDVAPPFLDGTQQPNVQIKRSNTLRSAVASALKLCLLSEVLVFHLKESQPTHGKSAYD